MILNCTAFENTADPILVSLNGQKWRCWKTMTQTPMQCEQDADSMVCAVTEVTTLKVKNFVQPESAAKYSTFYSNGEMQTSVTL